MEKMENTSNTQSGLETPSFNQYFLSSWKYFRWTIIVVILIYFNSLHNNYVFFTVYDFPKDYVINNIVFRTVGLSVTVLLFWFLEKRFKQLTKL
jgi:hypothetical protein